MLEKSARTLLINVAGSMTANAVDAGTDTISCTGTVGRHYFTAMARWEMGVTTIKPVEGKRC
jgi:hypothetical protein